MYNQSSLRNCCYQNLSIGKIHSVWSNINLNRKDIRRASVKCRLLSGTYILQTNQAKFNGNDVDPTCPLCRMENEDIIHFLIKCNSLHQYRRKYLHDLKELFDGDFQMYWTNVVRETENLLKLILDPRSLVMEGRIPDCSSMINNIENITRKLCFNLHCGRTFMLNQKQTERVSVKSQ